MNLLSFKDIGRNRYHIETLNENNAEYLRITKNILGKKYIQEKLKVYLSRLYYTIINAIESYEVINQEFTYPKIFLLWHDRLRHRRSTMMRKIIENSYGHPLKNLRILLSNEIVYTIYSQGKFMVRPSPSKVGHESSLFLQRVQGHIYGPIHPSNGPFCYFILIDASLQWSHVCLLSTHSIAFARLLADVIRLKAQFLDYSIKTINLDNAGEFTSKTFDD